MNELQDSNLLNPNRLPNPSFQQVTLSETKSLEADLPTTPTMNEVDTTILVLLFWSICWGIISLVLFKFFRKLRRVRSRGLTDGLFSPLPCRKCRFFAHNQYLKCAVHPSTVLTAQAAHCSDYCCQDNSYQSTDCPRAVSFYPIDRSYFLN